MTASLAEVRFGRLERRGLLAGLSGAQLALLGAALIVLVAAGMSGGPITIALASPVWATSAMFGVAQAGGRPLTELMPVAVPWALRRLTHRHAVLARPQAKPVCSVPGVCGRLRIASMAGTSAAVLEPARRGAGPVVVVARVRGRGFLLGDDAAQERCVAGWGRVLSSLGQTPHVVSVQVLHRASRDGGEHLQRWWSAQCDGASWPQHVMADLVEDARAATRMETFVAVAVRPRRNTDLPTLLRTLADTFDGADVSVQEWLDEPALRRVVRSAYDPQGMASSVLSASAACGPMGVVEAWSYARSDSGFHATFWVSEWPRSLTHAGFLRPLLLAPGAHRTFSLIAQPLSTDKALREIRRARAEQIADAAARHRIGQVEEEVHRAAADELTRREEDLIAGHGDLRFVGLVSVTATSAEELEEACLSLQASAGQAGCELRRLVGQQVQAFAAAALPIARIPR